MHNCVNQSLKFSKQCLQMFSISAYLLTFVHTCRIWRNVLIVTQTRVFLMLLFVFFVADYGVHGARHGPRLAYRRAGQPERQSACHIPGASKLDGSSRPQTRNHTEICMNKYSSTAEHSVKLSRFFFLFYFFSRFTSRSVVFWCYCA